MIRRLAQFEKDTLGRATSVEDLLRMLQQTVKSIGTEIDYIEGRISTEQTQEAVTVTLPSPSVTQTGEVAINMRSGKIGVSPTVETPILYSTPLVNDDHYVRIDFLNAMSEIGFVNKISQDKAGFKIVAPENGTIRYFAVDYV